MAFQSCAVHSGMPPGCSVGQYKSSADASPLYLRGEIYQISTCWTWWGRTPWLLHLQKGACHWDPEWKNWLVYPPLVSQLLLSQRRLHNRRICPCAEENTTGFPWVYPFIGGWVQLTPSRAGRLAHEHSPGSPTGFYLLGVPADDHISLPSDRWGTMLVPVLDHCPEIPGSDIPTTGPVWTLRSTWLLSTDWGALSECNAL